MRKSGFFPKLALVGILRSGQFYLPYFLTCSGTVAMFYILSFLTSSDLIGTLRGAATVQAMLNLGCIVVGLFSVALIFYTNGFLMKRRRRELGLYNILGMEKRHLARLLCCEGLILGAGSIAAGLAVGILLSKLMLLVLLDLLRLDAAMGFSVSGHGILDTVLLFSVIFLTALLYNLARIHLSNPMELLSSSSVGEREPKTRWVLVVTGLATIVAGYGIANVVKDPLSALLLFFVAVLLVIIGTYCLFTAGSIALLKHLRTNRNYYYRPEHFTAVSGLLYRMKQNAVGLASICILSTMVLVTVSTTACLYLGASDALNLRYPTDIAVTRSLDEGSSASADTRAAVEQTVLSQGRAASDIREYTYLSFMARLSGNTLALTTDNASPGEYRMLIVLTAAEYGRVTGDTPDLSSDEVLSYSSGRMLPVTFYLDQTAYHVVRQLDGPPTSGSSSAYITSAQYLVVANDDVLALWDQVQKAAYGEQAGHLTYELDFNLDGTDAQKIACADAIRGLNGLSASCRQKESAEFYAMNGGFLFLGLFLGLLFGMATVLIIYYKQISEGYEDQRRFEIMQKVGMSEREVHRSVQSQILLVFFLPLAVAAIHIAAAFHMITRVLVVFSLTNVKLFALCTLGTLACFALLYALVYWATARTYYKIVRA